ncbi:hypothetical protein Taro_024559 [Colocasia esculenta]|uniref:Uncharacterized protein n=1 Tax=Colocasia esculenta TaxID=4460 RepID=A0A843VEX2_COLES|nr:hypothetical protein [Colocasia esculenta]
MVVRTVASSRLQSYLSWYGTPRTSEVLPSAGQPVLLLTALLFVAPKPPREARRETVVRTDYDSYCCATLCSCTHSNETWRFGPGSRVRLLSSGRVRVEQRRWGDLCYKPSGSPDLWAAIVKIRSSLWPRVGFSGSSQIDSLAGRRVRTLNFSGQVVVSVILMSDDNDNVVMGKKLGGEYYEMLMVYVAVGKYAYGLHSHRGVRSRK